LTGFLYRVVLAGYLRPQALDQCQQHLVADAGILHQQGLDLPGDEREAHGVALGPDVGRPRTAIENRDLPEELTGAHGGDPLAIADHRDLSLFDDVEPKPIGARLDDRGALLVALLLDELPEQLELFAIEAGKERHPSQRLGWISLDSHRFLLRLTARHYDTAPSRSMPESRGDAPPTEAGGATRESASGL
jgi:hypothetical protein